MTKISMAELLRGPLPEGEPPLNVSQDASGAAPSLDARFDPPAHRDGASAAQTPLLRAGPARPVHPYWQGKPLTESALRAVHLWPRTKPAPKAVANADASWRLVLMGSRDAHKRGGARAAVQVMVDALAVNYRQLGAGGAPPVELLRRADHPDLAPTDPDRIRFDGAKLLIVKIEVAMAKAYERGGEWRQAIQTVTTPSSNKEDPDV